MEQLTLKKLSSGLGFTKTAKKLSSGKLSVSKSDKTASTPSLPEELISEDLNLDKPGAYDELLSSLKQPWLDIEKEKELFLQKTDSFHPVQMNKQRAKVLEKPGFQDSLSSSPSEKPGFQDSLSSSPSEKPGFQDSLSSSPSEKPGFQDSLKQTQPAGPAQSISDKQNKKFKQPILKKAYFPSSIDFQTQKKVKLKTSSELPPDATAGSNTISSKGTAVGYGFLNKPIKSYKTVSKTSSTVKAGEKKFFSLKSVLVDSCMSALLFFPSLLGFVFLTYSHPMNAFYLFWPEIIFCFLFFHQIYLLAWRVFCFETYGEQLACKRLARYQQINQPVHPLLLFWRFLLMITTGFVSLPLLSALCKKDITGALTGLYLQNTKV